MRDAGRRFAAQRAWMGAMPAFSHAEEDAPAWDQLSGIYDRQLWLERRAVDAALDLARPSPAAVLLDAGTGTGAMLRALATRPDRPHIAVGVDASAAMLGRVPRLPDGWQVRRASIEALPFDDASFDLALAAYVLHVLEPSTRTAALGELRRVLRPGGRLVTITPVAPGRALSLPFWLALSRLARAAPRRFGGLRHLDPRVELIEAGLHLERACTVRTGYYSLCVAARVPVGSTDPGSAG